MYDGSAEEDSPSSSCQGLEDICTRTYTSIHVDLATARYGFHNFGEHINLQRYVIDVKNRASHPASIIIIISRLYPGQVSATYLKMWGCFTNVSRALQNILYKFVYCKNRTYYESFTLKLCTCAQPHAFGTHTKFQLEILTINVSDFWHYIFSRDYLVELAKR